MSEVINFESMADRMAFLRGKHTEVKPKEVMPKMQMMEPDEIPAEPVAEEPKEEPKPKKKSSAKKKTTKKKKEEEDAVQAD